MEEPRPDEGNLFEKIKAYVQVRIRLALLNGVEKGAELYAKMISNSILVLVLFMLLLFCSLALAFYLSELFQSYWCGFSYVAGIYLLVCIVLLLIRKKFIEKPLMDQFVQQMLGQKDEVENEK